jgi:hypothetical protein
MAADQHTDQVLTLLVTLGPLCLVGTILGSIAILTAHWRASRQLELGAELIQRMLDRKLTGNEIERIVIAWAGDKSQLDALLKAVARVPLTSTGAPLKEVF